jgi:hypothetical protein
MLNRGHAGLAMDAEHQKLVGQTDIHDPVPETQGLRDKLPGEATTRASHGEIMARRRFQNRSGRANSGGCEFGIPIQLAAANVNA